MPKSISEIVLHADELAQRFENFDPSLAHDLDPAEGKLIRNAIERALCEQRIAQDVVDARQAGISWKKIGATLGISAQAAQQRYGSFTSPRV